MTWKQIQGKVIQRDKGSCQFCMADQGRMDVHHITPRKYGGSNSMDNLILLCSYCHSRISRPEKYGLPLSALVFYLAKLATAWGENVLDDAVDILNTIQPDDLYMNQDNQLCAVGANIVQAQSALLRKIAAWQNEAT